MMINRFRVPSFFRKQIAFCGRVLDLLLMGKPLRRKPVEVRTNSIKAWDGNIQALSCAGK